MFQKLKQNLLLDSKIAVSVVVAILFVLGIIQIAQGLIDTHNYRDQFVKIIKEKTGREVSIKGKVSVSLLPTPTVYIPNIELRDTESKAPIPSITIDMIQLDVPLGALFSEHPRINSITLHQPVLEIDRSEDNAIHWDWLNAGLIKALANVNSAGATSMDIVNGGIIYHDNRTGKDVPIENLRASIAFGNRLGIKGSFAIFKHQLEFSLNTNGLPAANGELPLTAEIHADSHNAFHWQGNVNLLPDTIKATGKFDLALQNVLDWSNAKPNETTASTLLSNLSAKKETETKSQMPLTLSGDWSQDGTAVVITNSTMKGLNSIGTGKISLGWKGWQPLITCDMNFSTLDYASWQTLFTAAFITPPDPSSYTGNGDQPSNILPKDIQAGFNISADKTVIGAQTLKTKLSASLAEASITVNRFSVELPGDSSVTLFGIVSQGATNSLRFEGSMETSGKSLRQALTVFDPSALNLPEAAFGTFYAHSNIFVSAEQVRLSEADVKLGDLVLNGGLAAYFDTQPRLEADIKLKDINFDYLRDVWHEKQTGGGPKDALANINKGININLLNKLHTSVDFRVNVAGYTFMHRKGDNASFRIYAKDGEIGLYDVRLVYPDETMGGKLSLDVKSQQPSINIAFNANTIDAGYFTNIPLPAQKSDKPADESPHAWSEAIIDTSWLEGYNGTFDININKLMYGDTAINRVKFQAKLDNGSLNFQNFTFDYWQGQCSILGSVYGGEVPGASISFILYNTELHDMLKDLAGRDNITGRTSISGTITTSGVNMLSWVSQSDGKVVIAGRGVNVTGFNLQGVMDAVAVSRTAADVFNNVNRILENGATYFSVDGNANIKGGVIKTPGITLKTGAIIGDLTGEVRLVPWTMDLSTLFQFPAITSETTPTMAVQLTGAINAPGLNTDTSSLEAYVAKRIISK